MRAYGKKFLAVLAVTVIWIASFGGVHINYGKAVLDVSENAAAAVPDAMAADVTVADGRMLLKVPKTFLSVDEELTGVEGVQYKLNELEETYSTSAEQLYVFYFENEKYLLYKDDAKNTTAVEMAIVQNILPGEKVSGIVDGAGFPSASKHDRNDRVFDYYSSTYTDVNRKTHHVEFAFTKDGTRGFGCILYVFTDPVHKADALYVMDSIRFAQ